MGGKSGAPPVGFRIWRIGVLLEEEQEKKFTGFLREYRARVIATAFGAGGRERLDRPASRFIYVPALAAIAKHVYNRSDSIKKAIHVWPLLTVKFVKDGKRVHGSNSSPVILDITRGEIRIPFLKVRKKTKTAAKIAGEFELEPKPKFVAQLQLKQDGMGRSVLVVNIIAFRETRPRRPRHSDKAVALAYDINSRYGVTLVALALDENGAKLILLKRYKPPNHSARRRQAAKLQSMGRLEAAKVRRKERKLNQEFVKNIVADARRIIRHWAAKGYTAYILVDKPRQESLRGTSLSGTLNAVASRLENFAAYEGAVYRELRASGKKCPICGAYYTSEEKRNGKRVYTCPQGHRYDRDFAASWNLAIRYFSRQREQIRRLLAGLGPRALGAPHLAQPTPA